MAEGNPKDGAQTGEPGRGEGKTLFEQFDDLTTKLLVVPKEELDEKRAEHRRGENERRSSH